MNILKLAPLFVVIAAVLWGVDLILLRPQLYTLPVTVVVFVETALAALLLSPVFIRQYPDIKKLGRKDWMAFFGIAIFGGAMGTLAITKALFIVGFAKLSIVALIQKLQPVWAILLASILLKERPSREFFLWGSIAIAGAYLMTFGLSLPDSSGADKTLQAATYALLAVIGFGSSTVFSKRALRHVNYGLGTYLRFLVTASVMCVLVLSLGELSTVAQITGTQWLIFTVIACSTGGLAIFLYYFGLKRITASTATICELAFPLSVVLLDYLVHDSLLNPVQWVGVALLLLSILRVSHLQSISDRI